MSATLFPRAPDECFRDTGANANVDALPELSRCPPVRADLCHLSLEKHSPMILLSRNSECPAILDTSFQLSRAPGVPTYLPPRFSNSLDLPSVAPPPAPPRRKNSYARSSESLGAAPVHAVLHGYYPSLICSSAIASFNMYHRDAPATQVCPLTATAKAKKRLQFRKGTDNSLE
jgi:hypothetical protein